jgi:hypothetical protein
MSPPPWLSPLRPWKRPGSGEGLDSTAEHIPWPPSSRALPLAAARSTATTGHDPLLGAVMDASAFFWQTREVLPQRGHGLRPEYRRLGASHKELSYRGPSSASWSPLRHPQKLPLCRRNDLWCRAPTPLGAAMDSTAFSASDARSTASTGAWPSPTVLRGGEHRPSSPLLGRRKPHG